VSPVRVNPRRIWVTGVVTGALLVVPAAGAAVLPVSVALAPSQANAAPHLLPPVQAAVPRVAAVSVPPVSLPPAPAPPVTVPPVSAPDPNSVLQRGGGAPVPSPSLPPSVSNVVRTVQNQSPASKGTTPASGAGKPLPGAVGISASSRAGNSASYRQARFGVPSVSRVASGRRPAGTGAGARSPRRPARGRTIGARPAARTGVLKLPAVPPAAALHPPAAAPGSLDRVATTLLDPLKVLPVPDWSRPIILALLLLLVAAGVRARWNSRVAKRLRRQGDVLRQDLETMQGALVPDLAEEIGTLAVSAAYRPADGPAAGGDFYDVFVRRGGQVAIILGDVSGHGREALTRAAHMRYTLRAYLEAGLSARDALTLAGETLLERGGEKFTTVAVAIYDPAAATLSYATAGHAPPILFGTPLDKPVTSCSSPPIGLGMPTGRRQTTVSLPAGSMVCFFSDGLTEARTAEGMLGRERLSSLLAAQGGMPRADALLTDVRKSAIESHDDMATCIIRAQAGVDGGVCCEVIELDSAHLASPKTEQFLQCCGVSREASFPALAEANAIAAEHGTAVLHIDRAQEPVGVTVAWPHSPALALGAQPPAPVAVAPRSSGRTAKARAAQTADASAEAGDLVLTPPA
jgi:serine phosphatase RsbU (regulator of sigma subunit)